MAEVRSLLQQNVGWNFRVNCIVIRQVAARVPIWGEASTNFFNFAEGLRPGIAPLPAETIWIIGVRFDLRWL